MPLKLVAAVVVIVGGAAYIFVPGIRRTTTETWQKLDEVELRNNWEFYYDESVRSLETKLGTFFDKQVDLRVSAEKVARELEERDSTATRVDTLISDYAHRIKAVDPAHIGVIEIGGVKYDSLELAIGQLRRLLEDRKRAAAITEPLRARHRQLVTAAAEQKSLVDQLRNRVRELKAQKDIMRADVEISHVRRDLEALTQLDGSIADDPAVEQIVRIRSMIDDQLLRDDVVTALKTEDRRISEQNLSATELIAKSAQADADADVESQLRALLGK